MYCIVLYCIALCRRVYKDGVAPRRQDVLYYIVSCCVVECTRTVWPHGDTMCCIILYRVVL